MEATLSTADNTPLIGPLSLNLNDARAPYIISNNQTTSFCPQYIVTHNGTNVLELNFASSDTWMDPASLIIAFDIENTDQVNPLEFLSTDMQVIFSRLQVRGSGVTLEDQTQNFNRLTTLLNKLQSTDKILETSSMALGTPQDMRADPGQDYAVGPDLFSVEQIVPGKIPPGEKRRVAMRLTTSMVFSSSGKFWPLFAINQGLTLLLTLDQPENVVKRNDANNQPTQSTSFQLSAIVGLWDSITLDSALQNKYFEQLASGQSLLWQGSQWDTHEVFIPVNTQGEFAATVAKNASRLMTVFNTFVPRLTPEEKQRGKQYCNTFQGYGEFASSRNDCQLQLHVGSSVFPQRPTKGYSEMYYRLLRCLGVYTSQAHAIAVSRKDFDTNTFVYATNLEKHDGVASTGLNTQGVDMRISGSKLSDGQGNADSSIDRVYFHTHMEVYVEIRAGSVTLLT